MPSATRAMELEMSVPTPDEIAAAKERLRRERDCDCFSSYPNCQCENLAQAIDVLLAALEQAEAERDALEQRFHEIKAFLGDASPKSKQAYERMVAERDELREALLWLRNLASGVGKAGGEPEPGEFEDAVDKADAALASRQKEGDSEALRPAAPQESTPHVGNLWCNLHDMKRDERTGDCPKCVTPSDAKAMAAGLEQPDHEFDGQPGGLCQYGSVGPLYGCGAPREAHRRSK